MALNWKGKFSLGFRRKFLTQGVVGYWNWEMLREAVGTPFLARFDAALGSLIQMGGNPVHAGVMELGDL